MTFITAALHSRLKFIAWCRMFNLFQLYQCSLVVNIHPLLLESLSLAQASAFPTEVHGVSTTKKKMSNTLNLSTQFLTCLFWPLEQFAFKKSILIHFCLNRHLTANKVCWWHTSHIPSLYCYAGGIWVTSCPYTLLCWWHKSHPVPVLYHDGGIWVTPCPCTLSCRRHMSHILSLYSTMMMAYESHPVPVFFSVDMLRHILSL